MARLEGLPMQRKDRLPLIVTHGGAASAGYRDVLQALERSISTGSDMFEFDVRRTADNALVVHHDDCIGDFRVSELTVADAERAAAALGYTLPGLDAVLRRARGGIRLDVELKEPGYEAAILAMLRQHGFGPGDFVMTSFEQAALDAVHAAGAGVTCGLLVYEVSGAEALERFARSGASFLAPDHAIADGALLREAAAAAVPLVPWTVNDDAALERLLRAGVAGVITDRPAPALHLRGRLGQAVQE